MNELEQFKKSINEKLDNLVGCLTRLNPETLESDVSGYLVDINELEEKIINLKKELLGDKNES